MQAAEVNTPKALFRKANVLAVDDVPGNLLALEAVLSGEYSLHLANSGFEAISFLEKRNDIDVILMDLQMPGMDGFEASAQIKKMEGCQDIPIIFITAIYKEEPFIRKGYEVGAVDYFSKPFDPEILRMKVGIYASFRQKAAVLKERERQIRESEELLRVGRKLSSVLESLPVGVMIADTQGRVFQTNEEITRIFNSVKPMESDTYGEILNWWDANGQLIRNHDGPLARALRGESSHNELIHIPIFDGPSKTVVCSASPLRGLDGKIVGAVFVMQDVTESKKIQATLEQRITDFISLGVELEQSSGQQT
jgi:CheY-like chemotaxis protein